VGVGLRVQGLEDIGMQGLAIDPAQLFEVTLQNLPSPTQSAGLNLAYPPYAWLILIMLGLSSLCLAYPHYA
jgi:hypothetical protein